MDDATALIASMRAKPEEDTPRLAYADLIEERGQTDRAELIRVQVARARLNPRPVLRVWQQFELTAPVHGQREFRGDFVGVPGLRLTPGLTFDAVVQMEPGAPLKTKAVGCVVERLNPPLYASEAMGLEGHVTGIPCPVRPEADALDAQAGELLLRLPAGTWCPSVFNWHYDDTLFAAQAVNPEPCVLVRRGFVEHVRCPWDHWLDWADWFRANHPCERVTLTTMPETRLWGAPQWRVTHLRIKEVPGEERLSEEELTLSRDRAQARIRLAATRLLARHWSGTTFAIP